MGGCGGCGGGGTTRARAEVHRQADTQCVRLPARASFLVFFGPQSGKLREAIDGLLPLEKKARIVSDLPPPRTQAHTPQPCFF